MNTSGEKSQFKSRKRRNAKQRKKRAKFASNSTIANNSRPSSGQSNERRSDHFMQSEAQSNPSIVHPSQSNWYWDNYWRVSEWQGSHQVAYWRARAIASEYENNILRDYIETTRIGFRDSTLHHGEQPQTKISDHCDESSTIHMEQSSMRHQDNPPKMCSETFEVSDEMMQFFKESMIHKLELKKKREEDRKYYEDELVDNDEFLIDTVEFNESHPPQQIGKQRMMEMSLLYGKSFKKVLAMETSLVLNFDTFISKRKPQFWPIVPLKL